MKTPNKISLLLVLALSAASPTYAEDTTPSITDIYSDMDTRIQLASKKSAIPCVELECEANQLFDARVVAIGEHLKQAAHVAYPQKSALIDKFTFPVAEKQAAGTASNSKGQVMVLRGVQALQLSDDALAFVMAREMAHVLVGHHKTNTSTKLAISALAAVLFPVAAVAAASSTAAQASTATSLVASAASTATSYIGGEVAVARMKPQQLNEADNAAIDILEKAGWDMRSAAAVLTQDEPPKTGWLADLATSKGHLETLLQAEDATIVALPEGAPEQLADSVN